MREVQKRQLQFGQIPVDKVWLDPKSRDDIPAVLKGLQHLYKEKQEELFMLLEKHILPGTHRGVGRPGMEMWRILVLGVLKQGLGCDFDRLHNLANHHETVRAILGHSDFADKTHYELQTIVDNVSLMRPELLAEVGRLVVESGHAVARKKPGGRLRGRCDSFVVETDVGKGVEEAECRLIRGYIAHARRQIDQVDRRLLQGERIPHQEKVFSIFEPHTRWISKGKAGRPVELGVAVCVVEDQYQFILHHKLLWKEDDVEVAVPMIEETQALYPDLRMCSFDRGFHSRNNRIRLGRQARVERATRQGTTQPRRPRAGRSRGVRGHETAASGGGVGDQLAGASRSRPGPHPRHRGLRAHGCAVGAGGGTCTAWGGSCDSRSRTPGNDADDTPPDRRRRCPHFAFEPAPEETGTAPYGRVPKIGAGPPPITPPRPIAGIFLDEIGLQLARKVWWIVTGKLR